MSYAVPEDVERGKNWADEVLQGFLEEYGVRKRIEKYEWRYHPEHRYSFLRITLREPREYQEEIFRSRELTDMDRRSALRSRIRAIVKSLAS
jgi:hypothetical protein